MKTGGFVQAWGQKQADGSLLATEVVVGPAGPVSPFPGMGFGRGSVAGTVASVNANGFTVTVTGKTAADTKTITVTVTSQTKVYMMPGMTAAAFSDVKVGSNVRVQGQADSSGVITAQSIEIEPTGDMVAGRVTGCERPDDHRDDVFRQTGQQPGQYQHAGYDHGNDRD